MQRPRLSAEPSIPLLVGLAVYAKMHDAPPFVAQDDKHEEDFERDCGDHEEVDRSSTIRVIAEECLPALIGIPGSPGHVLGHGGLADLEAELQELSVNARCAPQRIFQAHLPDQRPKLAGRLWPSSARSRLPTPIDPEALAMPTHQGLGMYDADRLRNLGPKSYEPGE